MFDSRSPTSCLPDEILTSIFEWLVAERPDHVRSVRKRVLPLQTVCRLWNTLAFPLLYNVLNIETSKDPDIIAAYSASLERARADGRDWAPYVRRLELLHVAPAHKTELERLMHQLPNIESIKLQQGPYLPLCPRVYSDSLVHLIMLHPSAAEYLHVCAFRALRTLYVRDWRVKLDGDVGGWALPALETLYWRECAPNDWYPRGGVETARFLARCSFPRLHTAELALEVRAKGGAECLHRFLDAHPGIRYLALILWPAHDATVLSAVRAEHLNIQFSGELESSLVHYVPPTVTRLDLPMFMYKYEVRRPGLARGTSTLAQLAATPLGVREVHLAVAERWGDDMNSSMRLMNEFKLHSRANSAPACRKELLAVRDISLRLWERDVIVYDQSGLAFKDHVLECESDPGSDAEEV